MELRKIVIVVSEAVIVVEVVDTNSIVKRFSITITRISAAPKASLSTRGCLGKSIDTHFDLPPSDCKAFRKVDRRAIPGFFATILANR